jgi:hypothetical protein
MNGILNQQKNNTLFQSFYIISTGMIQNIQELILFSELHKLFKLNLLTFNQKLEVETMHIMRQKLY